MPRLRRSGIVLLVLAAALGVSGCSTTQPMVAAPAANDPLCAEVMVRLPEALENASGPRQDRVWTDAQATGAWGTPTSVTLRCGVEPPGPSTLRCVTFQNVDWLVDPQEGTRLVRLVTYGRTPAVEVRVDSSKISPDGVLDTLGPKLMKLPSTARCTAPETKPPAPPAR